MRKDIIRMSQKELDRFGIIEQVRVKQMKQTDAAKRLELSERQIRRLLRRFEVAGAKGLQHQSRGKPSNRTTDQADKDRILKLWQSDLYYDFGPTLFSEQLPKNHLPALSHETLRKWYPKDSSKPKWRRKSKKIQHKIRDRRWHFGELNQTDGSWHDWFEGRGPTCNLQGFVDDATGDVFARFTEYEGTFPVMESLKQYSRKYGLPHCFYFDMHSTYKSWKRLSKEERLQGKEALSQFQRSLKELDIQWIHARTPQAKGRVERLFRTFQDRLIKEMRLANISSIQEANAFLEEYLPKYNKQFKKQPASLGDWHHKNLTPKQITNALCIKHTRVVQKDSTISYEAKRFLITDAICRTKITVELHLDGSLVLRAPTGKELQYKRIPLELYERSKQLKQEKQRQAKDKEPPKSKAHKPAVNHPWRKEFSRAVDKQRAVKAALSTRNN